MGGYDRRSDQEIIQCIRKGDDQAIDFLMDKYKNMVRSKAKALYLIGGEHDDLIQEGMIGLYKAIRDYNPEKNAGFSTFADLCTTRQIYTALNRSKTQKNQPLNDYVSIDAAKENSGDTAQQELQYSERWSHIQNPENLLIDREQMEDMEQRLMKALTPMERQVLSLYLKDCSYEQIAEQISRSTKAIDNAMQRIRKKLKTILS